MDTNSDAVIRHYQQLCGLSEQMLFAAQAQQWAAVVALGEMYCMALARLRDADRRTPLTGADRDKRHGLLLQILHNDARIRRLVDPGAARLERLYDACDARDMTFGRAAASVGRA